jgi:hypothetical protein
MKKRKSLQALLRRERARGRAEAVTIFSSLCPEDGLDKYIGCSANGESGDYSSYWDVDALRKLLCADTEVCDKIDRLAGAHEWVSYLEFDLAKARKALALAQIDVDRFTFIAGDMLSSLARRYADDVSAELPAVLKGLDAARGPSPQQEFYPTPAHLVEALANQVDE